MPAHHQGASPPAEDRQVTAVGVFAGRGDVILAMGLALLVGIWVGWQVHKMWVNYTRWRAQRFPKD